MPMLHARISLLPSRRDRTWGAWGGLVAAALVAASCGGVTPAASGGAGTSGSAGTSGGAGTDGGAPDAPAEVAPPTADEACAQVATAECDRLGACSATALKLFYGDKAVCLTRAALACTTDQGTDGITRTPADLVMCAAALAPASCAELLAGQSPAACDIKPGTAVNGTPCGSDWQCQSTYCRKADAACGVCGPRQAEGGDCTVDAGCNKGLVCANNKCFTPGAPGAACNPPNEPCRGDLYCAKATSQCTAKVGAGAACVDDQACDLTKGVLCINKVCETITIGKAGDACGVPAKALCTGFTGLGAGQDPCSNILGNGVCAKTAEDGTACGMDHKVCLAPANCVNGVCRLPSAPNCK